MIFDSILNNKWIVLFYIVIIGLIIWKRKKIEVQSKVVFLYKTKFGIKLMDKINKKHKELVKILGYCGIGIGYVGGIFLIISLIKIVIDVLTVPGASSAVAPVLPGIKIPGLGIIPFWEWLISIFLIASIHEFSHGLVAKAHGLKIKSTGIGMFLFFPIAFVEPDEEEIEKEKDVVQYSVYAAGPFANIILAFVALGLILLVFTPVINGMTYNQGIEITTVQDDLPADLAGLKEGMVITHLDNQEIKEYQKFSDKSLCWQEDQEVLITANNSNYTVTPKKINSTNPRIGVFLNPQGKRKLKEKYNTSFGNIIFKLLNWLKSLMFWLYLFSLGIGLMNLLPAGPLDGGRMFRVNLRKIKGKKKGDKIWTSISLFFAAILVFLLLMWFVGYVGIV